uniref:Uncharacterized protein n=1 Tax=Cuerna arida TaxID=1464854 RepID=A0A1B6GZL0_9HEMI
MIYEIFLRRYKTRIVGSPPLSHNMHSPVHTSLHLVTSRHFTLALHLPGTATAACSNHQSRMGVFCRRQPKSRNTTTVGPFLHSRLDILAEEPPVTQMTASCSRTLNAQIQRPHTARVGGLEFSHFFGCPCG